MGESNFDKLRKEIIACRLCRDTFGFEPRPIFHGAKLSKIMQISQAPSNNVHISGRPFSDLSGKRLKHEWYKITDEIFYNPNNFYITAMAHCYPGKLKSGGDRLPPAICAKKWLMKEMSIVESELIILIGKHAASYFFPNKYYNELILNDNKLFGKTTIVLPHPSPINIKWFKDNPEFMEKRLDEIRNLLHSVLNNSC